MRLDVTTHIVVHRSTVDVADYLFDPINEAQWRSAVLDVRSDRPGAARTGTRLRVRTNGRLRAIHHDADVVARDGSRSMTIRTRRGGQSVERTTSITPERRSSSLVTVHVRGTADRWDSPLTGRSVRRAMAADLTRLKTILELGRGDRPTSTHDE